MHINTATYSDYYNTSYNNKEASEIVSPYATAVNNTIYLRYVWTNLSGKIVYTIVF